MPVFAGWQRCSLFFVFLNQLFQPSHIFDPVPSGRMNCVPLSGGNKCYWRWRTRILGGDCLSEEPPADLLINIPEYFLAFNPRVHRWFCLWSVTSLMWGFALLSLQVVRAAEEAASTLASSIHPEQCIKVLCPIIQTADYPINLAAIKMQTKVIERISKESLHQLLPDIIPGLLQVQNPLSQMLLSANHHWTGAHFGMVLLIFSLKSGLNCSLTSFSLFHNPLKPGGELCFCQC